MLAMRLASVILSLFLSIQTSSLFHLNPTSLDVYSDLKVPRHRIFRFLILLLSLENHQNLLIKQKMHFNNF